MPKKVNLQNQNLSHTNNELTQENNNIIPEEFLNHNNNDFIIENQTEREEEQQMPINIENNQEKKKQTINIDENKNGNTNYIDISNENKRTKENEKEKEIKKENENGKSNKSSSIKDRLTETEKKLIAYLSKQHTELFSKKYNLLKCRAIIIPRNTNEPKHQSGPIISNRPINQRCFRNKENDFLLKYYTNFKDPLNTPLITKAKVTKGQSNKENIEDFLKNILKKEISKWQITEINFNQFKAWISKSFNFTYTNTFTHSDYYTSKQKENLLEFAINLFNRRNITIRYNGDISKYGRKNKYENNKFKSKIQRCGTENQLVFWTDTEFLPTLEIFSICDNKQPGRSVRKGNRSIQYWDEKKNIQEIISKLNRNRKNISKNITIYKYENNKQKTKILRGVNSEKYTPSINICSLNIRGMGGDKLAHSKIWDLEAILSYHNIDIGCVQETKINKKPTTSIYNTIFKKAYGQPAKGGLLIFYKPILHKFIKEIQLNPRDIMGIKFNNLWIFNIYGRQKGIEKKKFNQNLKTLIQKFHHLDSIFMGDFNLNDFKLKETNLFNFQIIQNHRPSRINNNIDHFVTNIPESMVFPKCSVYDVAFSDHRMVKNKIAINVDTEFEDSWHIPDNTSFRRTFIRWSEESDFEMNPKTYENFLNSFKTKKQTLFKIEKQELEKIKLIKNLMGNPNLKEKIIRDSQKKWNKFIKSINTEFSNNQNFWQKINLLKDNNNKIVYNSPLFEKEYNQIVKKNSLPINNEIINLIKNFEINSIKKQNAKRKFIISEKEVYKTIKYMKVKSTSSPDKITHYKWESKNKDPSKKYWTFIKNITKIFNKWLNPKDGRFTEIINIIKKRKIIFIHKSGPEGDAKNYRPISINCTLARIFLKILNTKISYTWKYITKKQFGFRKSLGTRIAVLNFFYEFNKNTISTTSKYWTVTIDIAKCFDTINHTLLRLAIRKFLQESNIANFLVAYYSNKQPGVYQGDPLSPILFAYISHFFILLIDKIVHHVQMYADDLIIIIKGSIEERENTIDKIYEIIKNFGMKPNIGKTTRLNNIKYLGIMLNQEDHFNYNLEKAKQAFEDILHIIKNKKFAIGMRLQIYKSIILSKLTYGFELLNLNNHQMDEVDAWIKSCLQEIVILQKSYPTEILLTEFKIDKMKFTLTKRKHTLRIKLQKTRSGSLNISTQYRFTTPSQYQPQNNNKQKKT
ncbi:nuclear intron maturase 1 [Anaeramoeba flamelloides]|uniref:Nuclear intron maturase 1 n=1 Tax=Anaeramoeba flamelloides TaxID=1746091 RepID=A0ABQ8XH53_9EUKA|nr:nuclear intron maturase 1 [Anaeramoeba flamelloides]